MSYFYQVEKARLAILSNFKLLIYIYRYNLLLIHKLLHSLL